MELNRSNLNQMKLLSTIYDGGHFFFSENNTKKIDFGLYYIFMMKWVGKTFLK